jgi:hypothetical protein
VGLNANATILNNGTGGFFNATGSITGTGATVLSVTGTAVGNTQLGSASGSIAGVSTLIKRTAGPLTIDGPSTGLSRIVTETTGSGSATGDLNFNSIATVTLTGNLVIENNQFSNVRFNAPVIGTGTSQILFNSGFIGNGFAPLQLNGGIQGVSKVLNTGNARMIIGGSSTLTGTLELANFGHAQMSVDGAVTTSGGLTVRGPGMLRTGSANGAGVGQVTNDNQLTVILSSSTNFITGATTITGGNLQLNYSAPANQGAKIDPLSALMIGFVTFIGTLIHVYSVGYMGHDAGYGRFFAYLNLFMFSIAMFGVGCTAIWFGLSHVEIQSTEEKLESITKRLDKIIERMEKE